MICILAMSGAYLFMGFVLASFFTAWMSMAVIIRKRSWDHDESDFSKIGRLAFLLQEMSTTEGRMFKYGVFGFLTSIALALLFASILLAVQSLGVSFTVCGASL
ncbi:hypothetical protein [Mesorhizobium sp. Mes31]|uniref:hypothetical protein n=1 Tax=Mesorhizobium sp. Mes31 TaxID=2926017 RepID=UPI0021189BB3|nr:hypothetical protein [Mesorhizobium sp. Mes31]